MKLTQLKNLAVCNYWSRKKNVTRQQSLVGLVVIDAELDGENHGSISRNCDRMRLKPLDARSP
jgi:hypothetical protein